ncbi:MAG: ribonuclease HI [Rhodobiaceae bacterium]|nr:ribonuclease HI [Rhodobiaceae bacterium]RPF97210.1 MAG: ribonuclease HI [Rhizobiales bacterium TMED227]|tara:strand:+ start:417 stop:860 length:444 start_codon:yes stop_codon:yes gene_type:complete
MTDKVEIYTDGACSGNPGIGGWGAYLKYKDNVKELSGSAENTTNNRMELVAAIEGLKILKKSSEVNLYTDSVYLKDGITKWIFNWQKNNWKNANKKDVKNKDLWIQLLEVVNKHDINWIWVKGHEGNIGNEIADNLATSAISNFKGL